MKHVSRTLVSIVLIISVCLLLNDRLYSPCQQQVNLMQ